MARKGTRISWAGGRKFLNPQTGRTTWIIERMRNGRRRAVRLDVHSEADALAELALYERDPEGYKSRSEQQKERAREAQAVLLTDELRKEFEAYLRKKGCTERHVVYTIGTYLEQWQEALQDRDLRRLWLQDLYRCMAGWKTAERKRVVAIKSLFSYLRDSLGVIRPAEDPTGSLRLPPIRPERGVREKGYSMEHVEAVYGQVRSQAIRDVLVLHAKCGMHGTEIERLARGEGRIRVVPGNGEIAGTITFVHKAGDPHVNSVDAQTLAAAQRLQASGKAPVATWIRRHIAWAAKRAGKQPINVGELRHSFVAWAHTHGREVRPADGGVSLATVASTIGHHSPDTTARFYNVTQIPLLIALPIKLEHPDDPVVGLRVVAA